LRTLNEYYSILYLKAIVVLKIEIFECLIEQKLYCVSEFIEIIRGLLKIKIANSKLTLLLDWLTSFGFLLLISQFTYSTFAIFHFFLSLS